MLGVLQGSLLLYLTWLCDVADFTCYGCWNTCLCPTESILCPAEYFPCAGWKLLMFLCVFLVLFALDLISNILQRMDTGKAQEESFIKKCHFKANQNPREIKVVTVYFSGGWRRMGVICLLLPLPKKWKKFLLDIDQWAGGGSGGYLNPRWCPTGQQSICWRLLIWRGVAGGLGQQESCGILQREMQNRVLGATTFSSPEEGKLLQL